MDLQHQTHQGSVKAKKSSNQTCGEGLQDIHHMQYTPGESWPVPLLWGEETQFSDQDGQNA
jgi:hypothetical protein